MILIIWYTVGVILLFGRCDNLLSIDQMNGLQSLYESTRGDHWNWAGITGHWNFSDPNANPCVDEWLGLTCNNNCSVDPASNCYVTEITLDWYNLDGTMPLELTNMTELVSISLNNNKIRSSGVFLDAIYNLTNLEYIDFSLNFMSGSISTKISNLRNLRHYSITQNHIGSSIPTNIGELIYLEDLYLGGNHMSGYIPNSICNLTNLKYLDINGNHMSGSIPENIGNLLNLMLLNVGVNHMSSSIPMGIYLLTKLQYLFIEENHFNGNISNNCEYLINLIKISTNSNLITGYIPSLITKLQKLEEINFGNDFLIGTIPNTFNNMTQLTYFGVFENDITGQIPSTIVQCTNMVNVLLDYNRLSGTIPEQLMDLPLMSELSLQFNALTGRIPDMQQPTKSGSQSGSGSKLVSCFLNNNFLSGSLPSSIGQLCYLTVFDINSNMLTGWIPDSLTQLVKLISFNVEYNTFSGPIPSHIGDLHALTYLQMGYNHLEGTLPLSLSNCTVLEDLYLENCHLHGSLSSTIGLLTALRNLYLNDNEFTSQIPASIGYAVSMRRMYLNQNQFNGSIPETIGNLVQAIEIYLHNNKLSKALPVSIGQMTLLNRLSVSHNHITGPIPDSLAFLRRLEMLYLDHNRFSKSLPTDINELSSLNEVFLNNNHLTGPLPLIMYKLSSLEILYLNHNKFIGGIPRNTSMLVSLQYLYINTNKLTGSVLSDVTSMPSLKSLYVDNNHFEGTIPTVFGSRLRTFNVAFNSVTGTIPSTIGNYSELHYFNMSTTMIEGVIPTELCATASMNIDVTDTVIKCYSGCLTSSEVLITGASDDCHNGSIMKQFLIIGGFCCILVMGSTLTMRYLDVGEKDGSISIYSIALACFACLFGCWWTNNHAHEVSHASASGSHSKWWNAIKDTYRNSLIKLSLIKLIGAILISLALNSWWRYGYGSHKDSIIESCASTTETNCYSFCDDVSIVDVNITDDDFYINTTSIPAVISTSEHYTLSPYCIAELPGHCAYDYWLVFKLVPLLLHISSFVLQCIVWYVYDHFNPQECQYNIIIAYLYPLINTKLSKNVLEMNSATTKQGQADRLEMLNLLKNPPIYSIFAFIEICTCVYVWGELIYPSSYCDDVRPLSLYYYPVLMSLLDLLKLNVYISYQYFRRGLYTSSCLVLFNLEIFVSNCWITVVLAVLFLWNSFTGIFHYIINRNNNNNNSDSDNKNTCIYSNSTSTSIEVVNPIIYSTDSELKVDVDLESSAIVSSESKCVYHDCGHVNVNGNDVNMSVVTSNSNPRTKQFVNTHIKGIDELEDL